MTQGRLYKSARATGPMADDAILALPAKAGGSDSLHTDASAATDASATPKPTAGTETSMDAEPSTQTPNAPSAPTESARIAVTDFDHIFADDAVTVADDDDLFPWELSPGKSHGEVPSPSVPAIPIPTPMVAQSPAGGASARTSDAHSAADMVSPISTNHPTDSRGDRNTPVVTYRSNQPRIRLTFAGAVAAVIGSTVLVGLLEALVTDHIGWFTGVLSLAAALAATWFVAETDRMAPTLAFPVAWLLCALVPGQFTAPPSGSFALTQVVVVLGVLGSNAITIVVGTLACYAVARFRPRLLDLRS